MPQTSTRRGGTLLADQPEHALLSRLERARRRIEERFYDRPEVRRMLAALILRRVLLRDRKRGTDPPESP